MREVQKREEAKRDGLSPDWFRRSASAIETKQTNFFRFLHTFYGCKESDEKQIDTFAIILTPLLIITARRKELACCLDPSHCIKIVLGLSVSRNLVIFFFLFHF
jgi:hypothetical protein